MTLTAYVEEMPKASVKVFKAGAEHVHLAPAIKDMYEKALGPGGVKCPGADPYPDTDLFSVEGVAQTLEQGERVLALAATEEDELVGAMVMDRLSPHHVEFNSMAVRIDKRGMRAGSAIVAFLRDLLEETDFTLNATELVTHSLASQAAHIHAGYKNICGFSFCHYPKVFFKEHPESVLWVVKLQGKLVPLAKSFRMQLGRNLSSDKTNVKTKILDLQSRQSTQSSFVRLSERELDIASDLLAKRAVYVPKDYLPLVQSILFQFEDILDRNLLTEKQIAIHGEETAKAERQNLNIEYEEGFGHSYVIMSSQFSFDRQEIATALKELKDLGKRFILVRLPAFNPESLALAEYLREEGFVFQSYLPLYGHFPEDLTEFGDILTLQWIKPEILEQNALPGETDSVVKVYGYPQNISGEIINQIRVELNKQKQQGRAEK